MEANAILENLVLVEKIGRTKKKDIIAEGISETGHRIRIKTNSRCEKPKVTRIGKNDPFFEGKLLAVNADIFFRSQDCPFCGSKLNKENEVSVICRFCGIKVKRSQDRLKKEFTYATYSVSTVELPSCLKKVIIAMNFSIQGGTLMGMVKRTVSSG